MCTLASTADERQKYERQNTHFEKKLPLKDGEIAGNIFNLWVKMGEWMRSMKRSGVEGSCWAVRVLDILDSGNKFRKQSWPHHAAGWSNLLQTPQRGRLRCGTFLGLRGHILFYATFQGPHDHSARGQNQKWDEQQRWILPLYNRLVSKQNCIALSSPHPACNKN